MWVGRVRINAKVQNKIAAKSSKAGDDHIQTFFPYK